MTALKSVFSHSPSVVSRKTGNEYLLVPVTDNIADMTSVYTLNETGAFIWDHIDGVNSVEDIIRVMTEEYETDFETAEKDVIDFIESSREYLSENLTAKNAKEEQRSQS